MATPTSTTPINPSNPEMRSHLLSHYSTLLSTFSTSPSKFKILTSLPHISPTSTTPPPPPPKTLYVLDSSFNPPTLAHLHIARTALLQDNLPPSPTTRKHILLLLATTNADKKDPTPASFPQRLCMLRLLAEELISEFPSKPSEQAAGSARLTVDIGVTKQPYFIDKSISILEEGASYNQDTEQVHLLGYDTLVP
ncbi:uncharacterized protein BP5553_05200 [Venustampulla echinocandica]|uniref:Cytidyltransferase-like domain-containing protein n=1 Tax=Venustampulla echinocandica TaxID=2656787 RepID=A0A370TQG6_9HELO|nr:uncharacterized protein BP5553_05200 [Venustampulla echinocandica]RDL37767.1 hypothetical protein BP5553_05200 [Venustampulla echinocandica]